VAENDSTEPYDGRLRFTEPITAEYDMMMMMPIEAYVLKIYVYICMYHAFHVSSLRSTHMSQVVYSLSLFILLFLLMFSFLTYSVLYSY